MKTKLFFTGLLLLASLNSFSQLAKGNWLLSGGLNFRGVSQKSSYVDGLTGNIYERKFSESYFSISPRLGRFITDRTAFGISLTGSFFTSKITDEIMTHPESKRNELGLFLFPFVRSYFPINDNFVFFIETKAGIGLNTTKYNSSGSGNWGYVLSANASPGLTYFLSEKFALELNLGTLYFDYTRSNQNSDFKTTRINGGLNFFFNNPSLGLSMYLGKKS